MYRKFATGVLIAAVCNLAVSAPVDPSLPCDQPVQVFGAQTILGQGVRGASILDRLRTFFARVCDGPVDFETFTKESGTLAGDFAPIAEQIAARPNSIAFLHFPFSDIEAGTAVDQLLDLYRRLLSVCAESNATCIIGGQQPVNAFNQEMTGRQLELERRASEAFERNYLPIYRYMQSESGSHRLMIPLDSGDGRFVDDRGHELLFTLYRNRLLRFSNSAP